MAVIRKTGLEPFEIVKIFNDSSEAYVEGKVLRGHAFEGGVVEDGDNKFIVTADKHGVFEYEQYDPETAARAHEWCFS